VTKYNGPVLKSCEEQIAWWVAGDSFHSDHRGLGPECCPDFSCCNPELLQPMEVRLAYQAAGEKQRGKLCMMFLGGMLAQAAPDLRAYITDGDPENPS